MVESESILEERKKLLEQLNRKPKLDVSYAKEDFYALVGNDPLVNRGRYTAPGVSKEQDGIPSVRRQVRRSLLLCLARDC